MTTKTNSTSITEAIAQGEAELTPDQARAKEITERLQNPLAPQIRFGKRKVKAGIELHFEIHHQGEKFGRIIVFKSRHDVQAAAALSEAVVRGLFAKEYEEDEKFLTDTQPEMSEIINRMHAASEAEKAK